MKKISTIIGSVLLFGLFFLLGWESCHYFLVQKSPTQAKGQVQIAQNPLTSILNSVSPEADMAEFWKVWKILSNEYVDETALDRQSMVYGAIKGMVGSLKDRHTVYMTPEETKGFNQSLDGTLDGIGVELMVEDQNLVIASFLKTSPAEKAGLQIGDIIYKIDGNSAQEMTIGEAVLKIRGEKGTKVILTILRKEREEPLEIGIVRDTLNIDSVSMEDKGEGLFIVSINQFNENTKAEFESKVNELLLKNPKGLILDLRNNGGGYLHTAVDVLSAFLEENAEAVSIQKRKSKEILKVSGKPQLPALPLVVLINGNSASASEIVAGAIQDYKRGILIGTQSYGKGTVQEVDELSDGSSLRLTIAKWFTPKGKNIHKTGLKPDIVVKISEEDFKEDKDPQLNAAREYLKKL